MIVILLLVIIAILLFGAAAVRSAIGILASGIVAFVFLLYLLGTGWHGVATIGLVLLGVGAAFVGSVVLKARADERATETRTQQILAMSDEDRALRLAAIAEKQKAEAWQRRYEAGRKAGPHKRK